MTTVIEPDYFEIAGQTIANLDTCPECCGDGEIDILVEQPRRAPVFAKATCPCCGGDGLVFPSELAKAS